MIPVGIDHSVQNAQPVAILGIETQITIRRRTRNDGYTLLQLAIDVGSPGCKLPGTGSEP